MVLAYIAPEGFMYKAWSSLTQLVVCDRSLGNFRLLPVRRQWFTLFINCLLIIQLFVNVHWVVFGSCFVMQYYLFFTVQYSRFTSIDLLLSCECHYCSSVAVCDCGISWSNSLFFVESGL